MDMFIILIGRCFHICIHVKIYQIIHLSMCSLLYFNYSSIKLFAKVRSSASHTTNISSLSSYICLVVPVLDTVDVEPFHCHKKLN